MHLVCLGLATAVTLLALITHITIGTAQNAAPILSNSSLPDDPRNTLMFSWRANSVLMLFMTIAFGAGFFIEDTLLILYNSALAGGLGLMATIVAVRVGVNPLKFPPVALFICIALLGLCSLIFK